MMMMMMMLFGQSAFLFKSIISPINKLTQAKSHFPDKKTQGKGKNQQKKYTTGVNTVQKSFAISHRT